MRHALTSLRTSSSSCPNVSEVNASCAVRIIFSDVWENPQTLVPLAQHHTPGRPLGLQQHMDEISSPRDLTARVTLVDDRE